MIEARPCGACAELVPADEGCKHWRPGQTAKGSRQYERRRRDREKLEQFRRMMRLGET